MKNESHAVSQVEEVARCPFAEACWYLPVTREQFRLSGAASLRAASLKI